MQNICKTSEIYLQNANILTYFAVEINILTLFAFNIMEKTKDNQKWQKDFIDYLNNNIHLSSPTQLNDYFHVDVVAHAYEKGREDGENAAKDLFLKEITEKAFKSFTENATHVYLLSKKIIDYLIENKCKPCSLFININEYVPSIIISIPDKFLLDDQFIYLAYSKLFEIKNIYQKLNNKAMDIGFIGSENLDIQSLKADGYGYIENYCG
jgi:hypothetical protein